VSEEAATPRTTLRETPRADPADFGVAVAVPVASKMPVGLAPLVKSAPHSLEKLCEIVEFSEGWLCAKTLYISFVQSLHVTFDGTLFVPEMTLGKRETMLDAEIVPMADWRFVRSCVAQKVSVEESFKHTASTTVG